MRGSFTLLFFLLFGTLAQADVPNQMHYNGYLVNGAGDPVDCADSIQCANSFDLTFRLYESPEQGGILWEETHSSVPFYDGSFHVVIGSINPITASIVAGPTWLGIRVNDNLEMSPRQRLVSSAYALHAQSAETSNQAENATHLGGVAAAEYHPGPKFSGSFNDLTDVPLDLVDGDNDSLGALICAPGMVAKVTVAGWACDNDATGSVDTNLSEAEVDAMVSNNGYATQTEVSALASNLSELDSSLAPVAKNGLPIDLMDGDDDALGNLLCVAGEIASWDGTSWICSARVQGSCIPGQVVQSVNADGSVTCSDSNVTLAPGEPSACTEAERGEIYISEDEGLAHLCDGTKFHRIKLCGGTCDASLVSCGKEVLDDCGYSCGITGTALNTESCTEASALTCGTDASDECGNLCGYKGLLCPDGSNCEDDVCVTPPATATYDTLNFNGMSFYALNLDECHPGGGNCCGGGATTQSQMDAFCVLAGHSTALFWTTEAMVASSCYCKCGDSWSSPCCSGATTRVYVTSVTCE